MEMRGVAPTTGYWQRDVLTGQPFTKDGWLRTGDSPARPLHTEMRRAEITSPFTGLIGGFLV